MTQSREKQIDLASTPYYHVYNRCVRQAYLFNLNTDIDHKQMFVNRMKYLARVFCIDVAAYAVMSNHYHIVVHIDEQKAEHLSEKEVAKRWTKIFKNQSALAWINGASLNKFDRLKLDEGLPIWRKRLADLSWFMRCLNEYIAREINKYDKKKGKFWEARFKSQALLDDAALLTCMQYVDLNPIRSGMPINSLECSDYTSIQDHLVAYQQRNNTKKIGTLEKRENAVKLDASKYPEGLMKFTEQSKTKSELSLPFYLDEYIALLEWTGKAVRNDKKGAIPQNLEPILSRMGINSAAWLNTIGTYKNRFSSAVGEPKKSNFFVNPHALSLQRLTRNPVQKNDGFVG